MQAMLRAQRPQLFAAGLVAPQPQAALAFVAAWQSGPPPAAVQAEQAAALVQRAAAAAAAASAASSDSGSTPASSSGGNNSVASARQAAQRFADPWSQAALAADSSLSAAAQDCACLGPDAQGRTFWAGQLNASYAVDAVRVLLPVQLNSSSGGGETGATGGAGSSQPVQSVPVEIRVGESLDHTANQRCSPGSGTGSDGLQQPVVIPLQQPLHTIACQPAVAGRYVTVALAAPASGQRLCLCEVQPLSVLAPAVPSAAFGGGAGANSSGAGGRDAVHALPAALLTATSDMSASQVGDSPAGGGGGSSTSPASAALAGEPLVPGKLPGRPACSRSASKLAPWWSLDTGLDGVWLRGLRLSVPFACQRGRSGTAAGTPGNSSQAATECVPEAATRLSVYVGDTPPAQLLAGGSGGGSSGEGSLCRGAVEALGGQPLEVDCGRYMHGEGRPLRRSKLALLGAHSAVAAAHCRCQLPDGRPWVCRPACSAGPCQQLAHASLSAPNLPHPPAHSHPAGRYITVVAAALPGPAPLSLCGVQLLGAVELLPGQYAAAASAQQVQPPELRPLFALPVDGDAGSCLEAPVSGGSAGTARWQLQLDGTYPLLAVALAASPASSRQQPHLAGLAVSLLDAGGGIVGAWRPPPSQTVDSSNQSSSGRLSFVWELPQATPAAAVRIEGFARLCEVQVLAASQQPLPSYQLPPQPQWQVLGSALDGAAVGEVGATGNSSGWSGSAGSPGWQLLDADPGTCLTAQSLSGGSGGTNASAAHFTVFLGRPYW